MNSTIKKQSKKFLVLALALGVFATSCKKENPEAPDLPPSSSMTMDNSAFGGGANKTEGGVYFTASALLVGYFNTVIVVNLAVPVAAFKEAINHEAVYDVNAKEWVWSYNVVVGTTYTVKLHASESGENINWKMVISQKNGFQDFVWYTGVSKKDGTSGTWSLNKDVYTPVTYVDIEWSKNETAGTAQTKFIYSEPNQAGTGNYILWKKTADAEFDGHYDIYDKGKSELTQIMWNKADGHGKVIDKDNVSHCWDTKANNQADISCGGVK
ncbi:MAG: hypothetical protein ACKOXB_04020 [Flavobacteriales bacterium]